jgi:hypothetical protein
MALMLEWWMSTATMGRYRRAGSHKPCSSSGDAGNALLAIAQLRNVTLRSSGWRAKSISKKSRPRGDRPWNRLSKSLLQCVCLFVGPSPMAMMMVPVIVRVVMVAVVVAVAVVPMMMVPVITVVRLLYEAAIDAGVAHRH